MGHLMNVVDSGFSNEQRDSLGLIKKDLVDQLSQVEYNLLEIRGRKLNLLKEVKKDNKGRTLEDVKIGI